MGGRKSLSFSNFDPKFLPKYQNVELKFKICCDKLVFFYGKQQNNRTATIAVAVCGGHCFHQSTHVTHWVRSPWNADHSLVCPFLWAKSTQFSWCPSLNLHLSLSQQSMGKIKSGTLNICFYFLNKYIWDVLVCPTVITGKKIGQILMGRIWRLSAVSSPVQYSDTSSWYVLDSYIFFINIHIFLQSFSL